MCSHKKSNLLNPLRPIQRLSLRIPRQRFSVRFLPANFSFLLSLFIICVSYGSTIGVLAQEPIWRVREGLPVGRESERYLRVLQLAGKAPLHPWTVRGFTPQALAGILPISTEHPWHAQVDFSLDSPTGLDLGWIQPTAGLLSNSAYPFGENDGSIWVGRGLTAVAEAG